MKRDNLTGWSILNSIDFSGPKNALIASVKSSACLVKGPTLTMVCFSVPFLNVIPLVLIKPETLPNICKKNFKSIPKSYLKKSITLNYLLLTHQHIITKLTFINSKVDLFFEKLGNVKIIKIINQSN